MRGQPAVTATINNGAGDIPWVKTPITSSSQKEMPDFVCEHPHWLKLDEVYKNAPDKKPTCKCPEGAPPRRARQPWTALRFDSGR